MMHGQKNIKLWLVCIPLIVKRKNKLKQSF